jgi:hypothetical protein
MKESGSKRMLQLPRPVLKRRKQPPKLGRERSRNSSRSFNATATRSQRRSVLGTGQKIASIVVANLVTSVEDTPQIQTEGELLSLLAPKRTERAELHQSREWSQAKCLVATVVTMMIDVGGHLVDLPQHEMQDAEETEIDLWRPNEGMGGTTQLEAP